MLPLSIVTLHVPEVYQRKKWLLDQINAFGGMAEINKQVLSYTIIRDVLRGESSMKRSLWPAAKKAWGSYHEDATHLLILADDMVATQGFFGAVGQIMEAVPNNPVVMFSMRDRQKYSLEEFGHHYWTSDTGMWGGAIMMPIPMLKDAMEWIDENVPEDYRHDDARLQMYTLVHGIKLWLTAPSLLEHVGAAESLLGNANRRRVAKVFMDDVSHIDFSVVPEDIKHTGGWGPYKQEIPNIIKDYEEVKK